MSDEWKSLAASIIDTIKVRANKVLEENAAAKDMLIERAQALAKLAFQYKFESDSAKREEILHEMALVKQTIENELSALALVGKAESISTFKEVVGTALGAVIKYLPAILGAI
jgi:acyl-CoA reductase-like NAD-dependent aldehyde dehydrogenase